uniref:Secreted protein n=1 Tax=Zea mays TaxID=4577 RepID=C4J7Z9_MAIZE|nr:unknown [Zea mays]
MSGIFIISLIKFGFSASCCCIWSNPGGADPNNPSLLAAAPVVPRLCNKPPNPVAGELAGAAVVGSWLAAGAVDVGDSTAPRTMWIVWSVSTP